MKKYILLSLLLLISILELFSQCPNEIISGPGFYTKEADYFCHQYVKAALLGDLMGNSWVNMTTGVPTHLESDFLGFSGEIATDPRFIHVCYKSEAKAVVPAHDGNTAYHSAIILNNGTFASTPAASTDYIYYHQSPRAFTSACEGEEQYYAPIPDIKISGTTATNQGMQFTLTLTNNGQSFPSFLQLTDYKWSFNDNGNYFTEVPNTRTSTSITLIANNLTGYSDVKYNLKTGCNDTTQSYSYRTKSVQVMPNCTGTLNGGSLYTFNTVPTGPNQIVMYLGSWTWVKTSGNASWSTANGGKNMTFTISSGCATFNAYNASCNLTFTFCKGSSLIAYTVMDMKTLRVIKEGNVEDMEEINALLDELPSGGYVINMDGNTTRYVKSN